jgi:hypothetical protein
VSPIVRFSWGIATKHFLASIFCFFFIFLLYLIYVLPVYLVLDLVTLKILYEFFIAYILTNRAPTQCPISPCTFVRLVYTILSWLSSWHSCFVFGKFRIKVSARRPAILTEVFLRVSRICRDNTLKLGHDRFLPNPFHSIVHLSFYHSALYFLSYWINYK